jgi:hypothetical protein
MAIKATSDGRAHEGRVVDQIRLESPDSLDRFHAVRGFAAHFPVLGRQLTYAFHQSSVGAIFGDDASQPWIQPMSNSMSRVRDRQGATSPEPYFEYLDAVRFPNQAIAICFERPLASSMRTRASS